MWLKIIGSVLVVMAGGAMGFKLANRYSERPRQIQQLIGCLAALKSYISYVSLPLSEALARSAEGVEGAVADLLHTTANILEDQGWLTPQEALQTAFLQTGGDLVFEKPELEILSVLGANLGLLNREEQQQYICMVQEQLRNIEQDAIRAREQNVKMYRYLGVCGSLALVILLL